MIYASISWWLSSNTRSWHLVMNKVTSNRYSSPVSILTNEEAFKVLHMCECGNAVFFYFNFSMVVGKIALIDISKILVRERNELLHISVRGEWLSNIIYLSAIITPRRVRKRISGSGLVSRIFIRQSARSQAFGFI